jgi:hypothetical protein
VHSKEELDALKDSCLLLTRLIEKFGGPPNDQLDKDPESIEKVELPPINTQNEASERRDHFDG